MKVRLHPAARAELIEARNWYYERSPLTQVTFAHAVDHVLTRIRTAPNAHPLAEHGTRKLVLQRFPFNIFYRIGETEILIVAVGTSEAKTWILVQPSLTAERQNLPLGSLHPVALTSSTFDSWTELNQLSPQPVDGTLSGGRSYPSINQVMPVFSLSGSM